MFGEKDLLFPIAELSLLEMGSGGFARRIAVFVAQEATGAVQTAYLEKILQAAKIQLGQDAFFAGLPGDRCVPIAPFLKTKQPETVLVFGIRPNNLCLAFHPLLYQPFDFYGLTWLWSDALGVLENDKDKKMKLWTALQLLFLQPQQRR
ncbi:MAG: hypothetical protein ACR2K1_14320 [Saprospiraceae bacterium]